MGVLDDFIEKRDLAAQLGNSARTLDRWETRRLGPPRIKVGKKILYRKQSVIEWLASRERKEHKRCARGRGGR